MSQPSWFLFDLGNTVIKLAYERVMENITKDAAVDREQLLEIFEAPGGYRDLERGACTFHDFYDQLCDAAGYRGDLRTFQQVWSDFFDGTIPGIEELLTRVRAKYRMAFLSNSNEIHAEVIPRRYAALFRPDDRFIFSYRFKVAKPDSEMFHRALEVVGAAAQQTVFIDDLLENVLAAKAVGMNAYQFTDTARLVAELERDKLI